MIPRHLRSRRPPLAALTAVMLLATGCSGDNGEAAPAEPAPVDYSERGPFTVGTTTIAANDTLIELFYPATDEADGPGLRYSTQDPLGDALREPIPANLDFPVEVDAVVDAPASDAGPFPLVLHSHGFGSHRRFSATHLAQLASWGLVTAAPDQLERGLATSREEDAGTPDPDADVATLAETLDILTKATIERGNDLEGVVDTEQVGVEGHGAGGGAALEFGVDPQVDVVIGQAPTPPLLFDGADGDLSTAERLTDLEAPDKPVMLIAADGDVAADLIADIDPLYDWLRSEKQLAVLDDTGHSVFTDTCQTFWDRGGLIGIVDEIDLPIDEHLLELVDDGCDPEDDVAPASRWPVIDHLSVARYLSVFGRDRASARLSLETEFLAETFGDSLVEFRSE